MDFIKLFKEEVTCQQNDSFFDYGECCGIKLRTNSDIKILNKKFFSIYENKIKQQAEALFSGKNVNKYEKRPALHTSLRDFSKRCLVVNGINIIPDIEKAREQIKEISTLLRANEWKGFSGKSITDVVNIGIGGSDLGPRMCLEAFSDLISCDLNFRFISDADPHIFKKIIRGLNPETTLFIIVSKSFTTPETLYNARKAYAWIGYDKIEAHFIAITSNTQAATSFGIKTILPIWDWVGGRYSLCSSVNLIVAIAIGYEHFLQVLQGAYEMDQHFLSTSFSSNLPIILALIGIINNNIFNIHSHVILTYSMYLRKFVPYIQQLEMESNGKSITNEGNLVDYATAPMIFGGCGNQAQHSYYQLLCQGTHQYSLDLVTLEKNDNEMINQMCLDKIRVLSKGCKNSSLIYEIKGGVPITHISIKDTSPYSLGALIALYEHKVFVQSVVWNINPFDQPGVEIAKHGRKIMELDLEHV